MKNRGVSSSVSSLAQLPTRDSRRGEIIGAGFGSRDKALGDGTFGTGNAFRGAADEVVTDVERRLRAKVRIASERESFENIVGGVFGCWMQLKVGQDRSGEFLVGVVQLLGEIRPCHRPLYTNSFTGFTTAGAVAAGSIVHRPDHFVGQKIAQLQKKHTRIRGE